MCAGLVVAGPGFTSAGAQEILGLKSEDEVIAVLRHFKWNQAKIEDKWYDNMERLIVEIGLKFDKGLLTKYPDISNTLASKNNGMCSICFCEFEEVPE